MPLYWFQFNASQRQSAALELESDEEAWREAVQTMCELLKHDKSFAPGQDWKVEVRDEEGLVYTLTVSGR
jgi:hypothetical protein